MNQEFGTKAFEMGWFTNTIRNPAKVQIILLIFSILLLAIVLSLIKSLVSAKNFFILVSAFLIANCIYAWPLFGRDISLFQKSSPEKYKESIVINEIIENANQRPGRSLVIPSYHQDELNYENSSYSINTFRLGGSYKETKLFQDTLQSLFNQQDPLFFDLLSISSIDRVYLKKQEFYQSEEKFGLFSPKIDYQSTYSFLDSKYSDSKEELKYSTNFINRESKEEIRTFKEIFSYQLEVNSLSKYKFLSASFENQPEFSLTPEGVFPSRKVYPLFEEISPKNIGFHTNDIEESINNSSGSLSLYARAPESAVQSNDSTLLLSPSERTDSFVRIPLDRAAGQISVKYEDPEHDFSNRIKNPSFEEGLWKEKVGDCNATDDNPVLEMTLGENRASEGNRFLELAATRHIACTNQKDIPVREKTSALFSFDYQSPNGRQAGFHIAFNDSKKSSVSEKISLEKEGVEAESPWQTFTKVISVPEGATSATLTLYSYSRDEKTNVVTRYDNFSLVELPDILDRYYLVSDPETNFREPREIAFDLVNPTKKLVHMQGATTPFYLAMSESFHPEWKAFLNDEAVNGWLKNWIPWVHPRQIDEEKHFKLNGFLNGWFVEPEILCQEESVACRKNEDGSYDIEMRIEFFPQRWFSVGLLISGLTFGGCIFFLFFDAFWRRRQNKTGKISS
ncbi:MAG: hypothetical protein IPL87_02900 [Candidatus Moraniibacteriota bacterium]|nr:MAG: hypothetical protein IPL87_02900 [Candidatus Moranbacteria bacterium]